MEENRVIILFRTVVLMCTLCISIVSCEKAGDNTENGNLYGGKGFFITNEGNYMGGNGSLSFYSYDSACVINNIFSELNNRPLGDVVNSATVCTDLIYLVVNNSGKIEAADRRTMRSEGIISGLISPRYMEVVRSGKAYVTSLFSDSVVIIDPYSLTVSGYINLGKSSERIVVNGSRAYISNWSGGNTITVIDTDSDSVTGEITLAPEPGGVIFDKNGDMWVLCSGGYMNTDYPHLYKIDPVNEEIILDLQFGSKTEYPTELCCDFEGDQLYFINRDIFRMSIYDINLPADAFIEAGDCNFYRLGFDFSNNVLVVSDAIDYMQRGYVYGYDREGIEVFSFRAGIIPGSFCFVAEKNEK